MSARDRAQPPRPDPCIVSTSFTASRLWGKEKAAREARNCPYGCGMVCKGLLAHPGPPSSGPQGKTLISLRDTYGSPQRWTDISVQEVALRIRNSEPIPLVEGDWLSPWNIDTFVSKEKLRDASSPPLPPVVKEPGRTT